VKIFRSFPLIAAAVLGLIGFGLFKTSNFVNAKVAAEKQLSTDSLNANLMNLSANPMNAAPNSTLPDTLTANPNAATTPTTVANSTATPDIKPSETAMLESATPALSAEATSDAVDGEPTKNNAKKMTNKSPKAAKATASKASNAKETATKAAAAPRFHVVVGTFKVLANAKAAALKFEQKTQAKLTVLTYKKLFRVSAGDFITEKEATDLATKVKTGGDKCIVLKF
jgi:cell division septation protein DedD